MLVRRCQMVWSSLMPCSRYSVGKVSSATLSMPICPTVFCGRITSICTHIPNTLEKQSTCISAIVVPLFSSACRIRALCPGGTI